MVYFHSGSQWCHSRPVKVDVSSFVFYGGVVVVVAAAVFLCFLFHFFPHLLCNNEVSSSEFHNVPFCSE